MARTEREEAIGAEATNWREQKRAECGRFDGPECDQEETLKKAAIAEFDEAAKRYWEAEAAKRAKQLEVKNLQEAMDKIEAAEKAGGKEDENHPAGGPASSGGKPPIGEESAN